MAKYRKPVDLWDAATYAAIEAGTLKLQPGQYVKCGTDAPFLSRLHEIQFKRGEINHIRAFHGPNASKKFLAYCAN